jgi:hypothetical protein
MEVMDLRSLEFDQNIKQLLTRATNKLATEHAGTEVSSLAIVGPVTYGETYICFDTSSNSNKVVNEFLNDGPVWSSEDEYGRFNHFTGDFTFFHIENWTCQEWVKMFEKMQNEYIDDITFIDLQGVRHVMNLDTQGFEPWQKLIFDLLVSLLKQFAAEPANLEKLTLSSPFRLGVWMPDSGYSKYWVYE